jgi:hypothetical protein
MKKSHIVLLLIFALLTSLACSVFSGPVASSDGPASGGGDTNPNILFRDDFSKSNSGWDQADWDSGITDYGDGVYRMVVKVPSYDIWANPGQYFDGDVRVDVDATKISGEDDNDYGLICRYSGEPSSPSYYFFIISSDGFAVIGKVTAGSTEYISNEKMQPSDAIKQGNTTNHLRADCVGSTLTLYVNGQQVTSTSDSSFTGGDVGLIAGTFDIPSTEIHFDNFVVARP